MSALSDIQKLILWCRKNGIAWQSLTCGTLTIDGGDLRLTEGLPATVTKPEPRVSLHTQYGAELLREAVDSEGMTAVVELDD